MLKKPRRKRKPKQEPRLLNKKDRRPKLRLKNSDKSWQKLKPTPKQKRSRELRRRPKRKDRGKSWLKLKPKLRQEKKRGSRLKDRNKKNRKSQKILKILRPRTRLSRLWKNSWKVLLATRLRATTGSSLVNTQQMECPCFQLTHTWKRNCRYTTMVVRSIPFYYSYCILQWLSLKLIPSNFPEPNVGVVMNGLCFNRLPPG